MSYVTWRANPQAREGQETGIKGGTTAILSTINVFQMKEKGGQERDRERQTVMGRGGMRS